MRLRCAVAAICAVVLSTGVVRAEDEAERRREAEAKAERDLDQAAATAADELRSRISAMLVGLDDKTSRGRLAALKAFQAYRIGPAEYKLFASTQRGDWMCAPADATEFERTVDVFGAALYRPYGMVCYGPVPTHYDPAWAEYLRFLEDKNPRVRRIAYAQCAHSTMQGTDDLNHALRGCRDEVPAVRSHAFDFLARTLRRTRHADPRFLDARDCVLQAIRSDHKVDRNGLFACAEILAEQAIDVSDELFQGMHDGSVCKSAAAALAKVDSSPEMIARVVAEYREDNQVWPGASRVYFAAVPNGPASPSLVALLAKLLESREPEDRYEWVKIVLADEYTTLHERALAVAEPLLSDELLTFTPYDLARAVVEFGRTHPAGKVVVARLLRHENIDVRWHMLDGIETIPATGESAYVPELLDAVLGNPDPDVRLRSIGILRRIAERTPFEPIRLFVSE